MSKFLKAFEQFGIVFNGEADDNYYATCPFTGKQNKFYVNAISGLWDSKTSGKSGNLFSFIRDIYSFFKAETSALDLQALAKDRKLPAWVISDTVVYNPMTDLYMIPYKNFHGDIINIGHYNLANHTLIKTTTLKQAGLGFESISESDSSTVYIVEGEWDYFALKWLLKRNNLDHNVVALPSANIFKDEWVELFTDKNVNVMLDNDEAGFKGADRIQDKIADRVQSINYVAWAKESKKGYDLRDYILDFCGDITSFKTAHIGCYKNLEKMLHPDTPNELSGVKVKKPDLDSDVEIPSIQEVEKIFNKWFKIKPGDMSLDILIGSCFANRLPGEPVWIYFVGAPGSRKTAMLLTLNKSKLIETVSTLTPAALISGMRTFGSEDPSLIPKLNGRILVIKDVTTMLSSNSNIRDEIFGMLRDAYDGYIEKIFGNGLKKSYASSFGVIGAVTPAIDGYQSHQSILGERFLKYRMERESIQSEFDIIKKAVDNAGMENQMNSELQDVIFRLLAKPIPEKEIPFENDDIQRRLIYMGMFVAKLRGSINMNIYTREQQSLPIQEVGTRISKALTKLAKAVSILRDHKSIGEYELERCKRVAVDTCPDRVEMIIRFMYKKREAILTQDIINHSLLSGSTVSALLASLVSLRLIKRLKGYERSRSSYVLTEKIIQLIKTSRVYDLNGSEILEKRDRKIRVRLGEKRRILETPKKKIKVKFSKS